MEVKEDKGDRRLKKRSYVRNIKRKIKSMVYVYINLGLHNTLRYGRGKDVRRNIGPYITNKKISKYERIELKY